MTLAAADGDVKMNDAHETDTFLIFELDGETFALEAPRAREVLKNFKITRVPRMPAHLPGIVSVRGDVVAVIDFGLVLGTNNAPNSHKGWLVIVDAVLSDESLRVGILANAVQDVIRIEAGDIDTPPEIGVNIHTDFIRGVSRQGDSFLLIVDVDSVIASVYRDIDPEKRSA